MSTEPNQKPKVFQRSPVSPIDLPEGRSGRVVLSHRFVDEVDIVSLREAFTTGRRPQRARCDPPLLVHSLSQEDHGVWMTDLPIEIRQAEEGIAKVLPKVEFKTGRVLIGGLGLGIVPAFLSKDPYVREIDVVEINEDVINLCTPEVAPFQVIHDDVFEFIGKLDRWEYDFAYLDTWQGTNEGTWWDEVFPLRRLIANRFGRQTLFCWAEDIMRGQIVRRLQEIQEPEQCHWYYREGLGLPMTVSKAKAFLRNVGRPAWEKRYGHVYPKAVRYGDQP